MGTVDILLKQDGKIELLETYILLKGVADGIATYVNASLRELAMATGVMYDLFIKEAMHYSDQDLYQACQDAGLDYDTMRALVAEARHNGQN